jgi:thiol-disulfide isomerase/thioredoxin
MLRKQTINIVVALLLASARAVAADTGTLAITDASGATHSVKEYRGRWILVNYWATWCSACIEEMPALSSLQSRRRELTILGTTTEVLGPDQLRSFVAKHPVAYFIGRTDKAGIPSELPPSVLGVQVRPISYLITPDGKVAKRFLGTVSLAKLESPMSDPRR